jgi:inner membrane protein
MFTHFLLALPLSWLSRWWSKTDISFNRWYLFWFLALFTHALLDCCTTYGTRLFLPFTSYQVAFNNISVIDPLFTIPFLLLLVVCLFFRRNNPVRRRWLYTSLIFGAFYMLLTFGIKIHVHNKMRQSLNDHGIEYKELSSTPTILNSVLWSGIASDEETLYVTDYSLIRNDSIIWISYPRQLELLTEFDSPALETMKWFSEDNYFVRKIPGDTLEFYSVKFGRMRFDETEPDKTFLFYWKFYKDGDKIGYKEIRQDNWTFKEALYMLFNRIGI